MSRSFVGFALALLTSGILAGRSDAQQEMMALLDDSSIAVVALAPSAQWIHHPLRETVVRSEPFKQLWRSPNVMKLRGGITLAEFALGDKLETIVAKLSEHGVVAAFDRTHQGVVLIAKTIDKEWLREYTIRLVKLMRDDAKNKGNSDPIRETEYRGVHAYEVNGGVIGILDDMIVVSNKKELAKEIADRYVDHHPGSLLENPSFQKAWSAREPTPSGARSGDPNGSAAWMYVDVQTLREAGLAKELLGGKAKDFNAELILGGLLATLHHTPHATASLSGSAHQAELTLSAPHQSSWIGQERGFFFGPDGNGTALPLLRPENMLASLSAYRDISQLWLRAGDLFDQAVNDQLAQADNTLTTLFSGRDFGEDILGAMQPQVRLVACLPSFDEGSPVPAIRLPAFALVAKLRDPKGMRPELKRTYQSLIGFLNIVGAQNGQPQLDLDMESDGDKQYFRASYVPEVDRKKKDEAAIQFNFSPSLAFVGEHAIVASTAALAKSLAHTIEQKDAPELNAGSAANSNTLLEVDGASLKSILQQNQRQLVAQNMLEKGHTKEEAEGEIGTLLKILDLVKRGAVGLAFDGDAKVVVTLEFQK